MTQPQQIRRLPALPVGVSLGMALMVISVLVAPGIDIFSKLAGQHVPPLEVTIARFAVQIVLMMPFVQWSSVLDNGRPRNMGVHMARGLLQTLGMMMFVMALLSIPVADAIAIFFVEPAILILMGAIFLKETIGWRRSLACFTGFLGALLIIQPNLETAGWAALLPVGCAFCVASFLMLTRQVSHRDNPWNMQFQAGLWGLLFSTCLLLLTARFAGPTWQPSMPEGVVWLFLLGTGVVATVSSLLGVFALRFAPASALAPLQYLEIVSAALLTWLVFGDVLNAVKWLGVAIIIASGLFIILRERSLKTKKSHAETAAISPP